MLFDKQNAHKSCSDFPEKRETDIIFVRAGTVCGFYVAQKKFCCGEIEEFICLL